MTQSVPVIRRAANVFVPLALLLAFRLAVATVFAAQPLRSYTAHATGIADAQADQRG